MKSLTPLVLLTAALSALATQPQQSDGPPRPPQKQPLRPIAPRPPRAERSEGGSDLSKVDLPGGDKKAATQALNKWLTARGIESKVIKDEILDIKRNGILLNIHSFVFKDGLDRLRFVAIFSAKDEFKKSEELEKFASRMNKVQNFLTVYVTDAGDFAIAGNLTFVNELTAKEFDNFLDLMTSIIQRYILPSPEVKKLLK